MGALTELYVDPAIAANSGSGTIGSPFGDLQYALNTATRDATNGNRINIKAGTAEILTASLSFATWGASSIGAQTVFEGYTSAAGDGGIGEISGNAGGFRISAGGESFSHYRNLKLGNVGAITVIYIGSYCSILNCEVHTSTGEDGIRLNGNGASASGNYVHDINRDSIAIYVGGGRAYGNYIVSSGQSGINTGDASTNVERNIISVSGGTVGIYGQSYYASIVHNSILSSGGTGKGIHITNEYAGFGREIMNNVIEGFSGAGGIGIYNQHTGDARAVYYNAVYNCTTAYSKGDIFVTDIDNETLSASPFAKSGANTFANRFVYFAPVNTGNVWGGAYPVS